MSMFLIGALVGIAVVSAVAAIVFLWRQVNRPCAEPIVPQFAPRSQSPRAITRITKDDIFWEINT